MGEDEKDNGALIYRESQLRKKEGAKVKLCSNEGCVQIKLSGEEYAGDTGQIDE